MSAISDASLSMASMYESLIKSRAAEAADVLPATMPPAAAAAAAANQATDQGVVRACAWCGAKGKLLRCASCKAKWFCNNEKKCLREAWTKGGHKAECKATQAAATAAAVRSLPPALTETPGWARPAPAASTASGTPAASLQFSDSFDKQPLDEDDECGVCLGDPLPRSGAGVVALGCSHRFHRACVTALRARLVASPCPSCDAETPPPPWDMAVRQFTRVRQIVDQSLTFQAAKSI